MSEEPWFGVRTVIEHPDADPGSGDRWYEERVTVWRAASIDEALALAEAEARRTAEATGCRSLDLTQAFAIAGEDLAPGTEVFSLIRGSRLGPGGYLDTFFDTGAELQRDAGDDG